ncbi:MAG: tRNA (N6-threonylcarbamoyladenosine(37)-N6)-methyltransferase TrmO [Thermodesulfobacteriota bacterium]|nr:tRNA (N6-threonylcarbamoyladenosine(37)-N6)-methyltransferase TrmO [Thermodesulfobacteriota bacterium]
MEIVLKPIGIIHTSYHTKEEIPYQGCLSQEIGEIEIFKEYEDALCDLTGFSHVILLYHFHQSVGYSLKVRPFFDTTLRGLFATRYPKRPNPIGLSVVTLLEKSGSVLKIANVDMLNGTPLLDIKPYVSQFDHKEEIKIGWLEGKL